MKPFHHFAFAAFIAPVIACGSASAPSSNHTSSQALTGVSCQQPTDCTDSLSPGVESCADGTSAGAQWDCVQGQCVTIYCENHGGPAWGYNNSCKQPTDCRGGLPSNAEECADGTSAGAQWDCVQGQCTISHCDNNGGPATGYTLDCQEPSDCPSNLTYRFEVCADGTSNLPQWDCVQSRCTITYCDSHGGLATACDTFNTCPSPLVCTNPQTGYAANEEPVGFCLAGN